MTQILVTRPGVLNQRDRSALRRAGVVCVEADDPSHVKLIEASGTELSSGDMLFAAMKGVNSGGSTSREAFTRMIFELMESQRATSSPEA